MNSIDTNKKKLTELTWESRYVESLPGDPERGNFTRPVRNILFSEVDPTSVNSPTLIGWSDALAEELGIAKPDPKNDLASIELLAGNRVLPTMRPYSARYGGHQFGHWAGQLGDGRAITLGEARIESRGRMEFQLKGAGPTPYSRRADGRAVLRSSLREFLCSEAMHFLGIPTTRALSLVATGDSVTRDMFYDGNPQDEPGAIVCRVSPSFLRFGNFEILAASEEYDLLKRLADFLIQDHYPELSLGDPDVYGQLLDEIARRTAATIAHWMRVGFVHGVMNTDNMSALGLTIDYGPYGWLEPYEPDWTPNTTDAQGKRYAYGAQPAIGQWNLARLCEAFQSLVPDEKRLMESLKLYKETFERAQLGNLAAKLGLPDLASHEKRALAAGLFELLGDTQADYVLFFRALSSWSETENGFWPKISPTLYADPGTAGIRERWESWGGNYASLLRSVGMPLERRQAEMKRTNPKYVLRNYLAQNAIRAAEKGDASVMERLLRVLRKPYDEQPLENDLAAKRPDWAWNSPGCSALSCSS